MNQYSHRFINKKIAFDDRFVGTIYCRPFDSEELKELVMRRHKSSGMEIQLKKVKENDISELKIAGLFNNYFNYSGGNPGLTLLGWLANITKIGNQQLIIEGPKIPDLQVLADINDDWQVILIQIILHKRMDMDKLKVVLQLNPIEIEKNIQSLLMTGLLMEKSKGVYIINRYVQKFIASYFHEQGLI